jgi:hypothetical protein
LRGPSGGLTPRYLVEVHEQQSNAPRTLTEWNERQARKQATREQKRREVEAELERKRETAEPVTFDALEHDGARMTLRQAAVQIIAAGGRLEVRSGRLVVELPPQALATSGVQSSAARAARRLYLAEDAVLAVVKRGGAVDARKLPNEAILPSGRLAP